MEATGRQKGYEHARLSGRFPYRGGRTAKPLKERFLSHILLQGGCWLWQGAKTIDGYGYFKARVGGAWKMLRAHRAAYELFVGPIPKGLTLDHLCRNPGCVNPTHLEPVTQRENTMRGNSIVAQRARQVLCTRGHEFVQGMVQRVCRQCSAIRARAYKKRKKEVS